MNTKIWFFVIFLFLLFPSHSHGAEAVTAKIEVDKAFMTIGDKVNLRVTVIHEEKADVLDINHDDALSDFEIKEVKSFSHQENGEIYEGKNFVITNYTLGEYMIKPIVIHYRTRDGKTDTLQTNQLYLTVQSVDKTKDPNSDIRGVKGVVKIRSVFIRWLVLFLVLTGVVAFCVIKWLQPRRETIDSKTGQILSPHDEAYKALAVLHYSDLLKRGEIKLYFLRLSEIIRQYLERRFQIHALEWTTQELLVVLKDQIGNDKRKLIEPFLLTCDLVKFAKYVPQPIEIQEQIRQAKHIVDITKASPQAETFGAVPKNKVL